ncbi:PREDICTED: uncharacterized protein LOC106122505 [Papilio xuthus]|uniref:Uncharacterized protein LOC106122505 n=1 Tax=Papilio xuthus TaxID=66420 RepID=A0AAJ6ZK13_PAPXU|nr:PREDICTED: uncharacterized protein LOC106122505 [Papilio xuthus]
MIKTFFVLCILIMIENISAFVTKDVSPASTRPNILESFQVNIDQLRECVDQSLARAASEVNEKQLEPILSVIGDQLNRISKAFTDLTAPNLPQ